MPKPVAVARLRSVARRRLPPFLFEYLDGGSFGETTLDRNVADLQAVLLRQRVLVDMSAVDIATELFGEKLTMPIALAPIGLAGMNRRRGEIQAARAAEKAGIPFTLSTVSTCSLPEVVGAIARPIWFQLYMIRDRGFMRDMLATAKAAGCSALLFTADMAVPGIRFRDYRSGLAGDRHWIGMFRRMGQAILHPRWAWDVGINGRPHQLGNVAPIIGKHAGIEDFFAWMRDNYDPAADWQDLDFIRSHWDGPLVVKGILDEEDARTAVSAGVDGIVVSNHGGRQLDGVSSTARALPRIARAVGGRCALLVDGGVRSGLDVVRMLALGAQVVMLGRAWAYALASNGEAGVGQMLATMEAEIRTVLALSGCRSIRSIDDSFLEQTATYRS